MRRSGVEFLGLLLAKMSSGLVEPRFIFFAIVGAIGIAVNLAVLNIALLVSAGVLHAGQERRHFLRHGEQFPPQ